MMRRYYYLLYTILACAILVMSCNRNRYAAFNSRSAEQIEGDREAADERNIIIDFALSLKGSPYQYGGNSPGGFDCSGFTRYVYRKIDVSLPHNSSSQSREGEKISLKHARKGDLVFFGPGGSINHVGLVVSNNRRSLRVIHSTSSSGVRIDDVQASEYWKDRLKYAKAVLP